MSVGAFDEETLIEFAITALLDDRQDPRAIVKSLVTTWPDARALSLLYALSMAASGVEHMLSAPETAMRAQDMWRIVGLLGVDLYTMQCLGLPHAVAADLHRFWISHDPFFLT
jgi:hypothetical protein